MALILLGKTKCSLCGRPIEEGDDTVAFSHFLPPGDPLWKYSDAAFHATCFAADPNKEELEQAWAECRKIWGSRPKDANADEERQAWATRACNEFAAFRLKQRGLT